MTDNLTILYTFTICEEGLTFEEALKLLKSGCWVAREPWSHQPIKMQGNTIVVAMTGEPWIPWDKYHHPLLRNDWQSIQRTDLGG